MRSLQPDLASRALPSSKAPSDFVTANRTYVTDGDRVIPLTGIWRDERFPDPVEQANLQAISDAIDETARAERRRPRRGGVHDRPQGRTGRRARLPSNASSSGPSSAPTSTELRPGCPHCIATTTSRPSTPSTSPGRDRQPQESPHYYRLQGPRLLIEWDNTQRNANHAHSVWRDPTSDFGLDVLARHRAAHHA